MKTIEYAPDGLAFGDASVEREAKAFLTLVCVFPEDHTIKVSTENFILAVRVLIYEGFIPHDQVEFLFDGVRLQPDKNGRLQHWPNGFCNTNKNLLMRLLAPKEGG